MTRKQFATILIVNIIIGLALIGIAIYGMLRVTTPMVQIIQDLSSGEDNKPTKTTSHQHKEEPAKKH